MLLVRHFYHVWAGGCWGVPVTEHAKALQESQFPVPPVVGITGPADSREDVKRYLSAELGCTEFAEADEGFEQVTLDVLRDWARNRDLHDEAWVLYAHSKGAMNFSVLSHAWRRSMTRLLVEGWQTAAPLLHEYDTAGCHWLTPGMECGPAKIETVPMYAGNFWWARASYLAGLPAPSREDRFGAEGWIGLGDPKAADLRPGWPTGEEFGI